MSFEIKTNLDDLSLSEIKRFLKQQKKIHFYKRIQFIQYKKEKRTHEEIASLLTVCLKTLTNWFIVFSCGGMKGLVDTSYDRRVSILFVVQDDILAKAKKGELPTISACQDWLAKERGISTCFSNVGRFLKKNGIVLQENQASPGRYA